MSILEVAGTDGAVLRRDMKTTLCQYVICKGATFSMHDAFIVDEPARTRLLSLANEHRVDGTQVLRNLTTIHPLASQRLAPRRDAIAELDMTLVAAEESTHNRNSAQTYIIVSYACQNDEWSPNPLLSCHAKCPLTLEMWQALLLQRSDSAEPIWNDQLCINQTHSGKKAAAIGAMDLLYSAARVVIVAFEDIALSQVQYQYLKEYTELVVSRYEDRLLEQREALASIFTTVLQARWFDRAWCLHEFLTGRKHMFLIPVEAAQTREMVTIIRIDGSLLVEAYYAFGEQDLERQNRGEASLLTGHNLDEGKVNRLRRFATRLKSAESRLAFGLKKDTGKGSYMLMFQEIVSQSSRFVADKLSIFLNTANTGLYLKAGPEISHELSWSLAALVSLAAGDPAVLTCSGKPLTELCADNMRWLRLPAAVDEFRPEGTRKWPVVSHDARCNNRGLELNVCFLGTIEDLLSPEWRYISIARWIVDHRAMCRMSMNDTELRLDMESDEHGYRALRRSYIEVLAAGLQLGIDWILDNYLHQFSFGALDIKWDADSRRTIKEAIQWAMETNIEEDVGDDIDSQWLDGGTIMWAEDAEDTDDVTEGYSLYVSEQEQPWYEQLLDWTEQAINYGLAVESADLSGDFKVRKFQQDGKPSCLLFAPDISAHICVPSVLIEDTHSFLARGWFVKAESDARQEYSIISKSRAYGIGNVNHESSARITIVS